MNVLSPLSVVSSLVALVLLGACSEKKSFAGGTANASANVESEEVEEVPVEEEAEPTPTSSPAELETSNVFKDCATSTSSNFQGDLYKLPNGTQKLPVFSSLKPIKEICLKQIDIVTRKFNEGFPGVEELFEWFALDININLKIETAGVYKFRINSDDGSKLFVDGVELINNDGQHSTRSKDGTITLAAGTHKVNLQYFQGPADEIALELFWTPPGGTEQYIPPSLVSRQ